MTRVLSELRRKFKGLTGWLLLSTSLLFAAGCGAPVEDSVWDANELDADIEIDTIGSAITGGWTTLTLINGWQNYNSDRAPAVGVVNGVVTFRGAIKGPNATSDVAFILPAPFRPYFQGPSGQVVGTDVIRLRTVMSGSAGGSIDYEPDLFGGQSPTAHGVHIRQDAVVSPGAAAKTFTSLDGLSFDRTVDNSTAIWPDEDWTGVYAHRVQGPHTAGVYVKLINGFVRFQGYLQGNPSSGSYLFNLPSQFRPGQPVYVPVALCGGQNGSYGRLNILANGDVFVQSPNGVTAAQCGISLEGANFSLASGGTNLSLQNNWTGYSPRAVKVRSVNGVVRFEGAIKSGTNTTVATLPSSMRPSSTVFLTSDSWAAAQGRVYVTSAGAVVVQYPSLGVSSGFTSLDSLSFGL